MTTHYPKNFGGMLSAFLAGWKPHEETVDFQHFDLKRDPGTGRKLYSPGNWIPCRSLKELIGVAQSWPIYDNYVTAQRFTRWNTETTEDGRVKLVSSDHDSYRLDRIYTDTDPKAGQTDCLDLLPRYKRMQDEIEIDGSSAVWINCSGRGLHSFTYLSRSVSVEEGRLLQAILDFRFELQADPHVPITQARMMRLPYSKNSRTGTWVVSVGRNMTLAGLRNAIRSELIEGCHWENPARVSPAAILTLHPGKGELEEYRRRRQEKVRANLRKIRPQNGV